MRKLTHLLLITLFVLVAVAGVALAQPEPAAVLLYQDGRLVQFSGQPVKGMGVRAIELEGVEAGGVKFPVIRSPSPSLTVIDGEVQFESVSGSGEVIVKSDQYRVEIHLDAQGDFSVRTRNERHDPWVVSSVLENGSVLLYAETPQPPPGQEDRMTLAGDFGRFDFVRPEGSKMTIRVHDEMTFRLILPAGTTTLLVPLDETGKTWIFVLEEEGWSYTQSLTVVRSSE